MTRIALVMTALKAGGITSSIINLLKELQNRKPDIKVDLYIFDAGEYDSCVPSNTAVLRTSCLYRTLISSKEELKKTNFCLYVLKGVFGVVAKIFGKRIVYRFLFCGKANKECYDSVISCTQSAPNKYLYGGCNEFALRCLSGKNKVAFVHCDFERYGLNNPVDKKIYFEFDKIATVSESSANVIKECFSHQIDQKIFVVHNCFDFQSILAYKKQPSNNEIFTFCTIARISKEKGHLRVLDILKRLDEQGYNFCWKVVGPGSVQLKKALVDGMERYHLTNKVEYLGEMNPPYSVMASCDALLVPSYNECAPMVFSESLALGIPVLTTNTMSADEMIGEKGFGLVCENDDQSIFDMLRFAICNRREIAEKYKTIARDFPLDNDESIKEFLNLVEK